MEFVTLVVATIILLVAYVFVRKNSNLPPGPYGLPLVGYAPFLGKIPYKTLADLKKKYGNVVSVNFSGLTPVVVLNDWQAVKEALVKQADSFSGRPDVPSQRILFDKSDILSTDGKKWKELRRFSHQILRDFGFGCTTLETVVMEEVDQLSAYLVAHDGKPVSTETLFFVPIMNIIWGICAGKQFKFTDEFILSFKDDFNAVMSNRSWNVINYIPLLRFAMPLLRCYNKFLTASKKITDYLGHEVDNHVNKFDENNLKDFIDAYLAEITKRKVDGQEQLPFNKKHLVMIMFDFFLAGQDTTDNSLCWALLYMIHHPDVQRKVQQELDWAFTRDSYLSPTSKSLIPYTEATLLEIQRIATIAPLSAAHRTTKEATLLGHHIPKNTTVFPNLYAVHHDEQYWGDPEVFRPERFLDDNGKVIKHECFVPFSAGPRTCLGESLARLELFLFFSCLMRRFTFERVPGEPLPTLEPIIGVVVKSHPFNVIVKCR